MTKQFNTIEAIREERQRLEAQCKVREAELSESLEYVQEHFGSLLLRSLLPFSREQKDKVGGFIDKVHGFLGKFMPADDSKWQAMKPVLKILQMIVAGVVYRFIKKKVLR